MGNEKKEWFNAIRRGRVIYITNLLNALKDKRPGKLKNLVKRLHSVDGTQSTALHLSCQYDHCSLVVILLQNGASPNLPDQSGCTALHMAAWSGNAVICDKIMENSQVPVEVNAKNSTGDTPLHLASQHGHERVVETLLTQGADPLITNDAGLNALSMACHFGRTPVVTALVGRISMQAKSITEFDVIQQSALHLASQYGHSQVVQILLENGFPVNCKTKDGRTCLHEAVTWNRVPVVTCLLSFNIDKDAKDAEGRTAMDILATNRQEFGIKMREMIANHVPKVKEEDPGDSVDGACMSRSQSSKKKKSIKRKEQKEDEVAEEEEEEDKEMAAILEIGAVLSQSSDSVTLTESPRDSRPSTPQRMRLLSSKYRAQFERICSEDQEDEDIGVFDNEAEESDVFQ